MKIKHIKTRYLQLLLLSVFFLEFSAEVFAQERKVEFTSDQFKNLSYKEIGDLEFEAMEKENWKKLSGLTNFHLRKAKAEKNPLEVARGYYYMTVLEEPDVALQYADSVISISHRISHPNYPTLGFSLKGHLYFTKGNFPLALENYLIAYNIAVEKENVEHQRDISLAIAAIRNINGQHYAAAELYKRSLKLLKTKPDFENQNYEEYLILIYNLSISHLQLKEVDSAKFYALKGIDHTLERKDKKSYRDFVLLDAQVNFYQSDLNTAKDTLYKYLKFLNGTQKAINIYYLGEIEERRGNKDLAIKYYEQIDSIISITKDPFTEVKDVYQKLITHSLKEKDKRMQVEYIDKFLEYDSILSSGKEDILNKAVASYDIPLLKQQKKYAEEQLEAREKYILLVGSLAGLGSLSGLYFYSRTRRMKAKLKVLLKVGLGSTKRTALEKSFTHPSAVPEDVRNDLLKKLEKFEASDRVFCKSLDMYTLAEEFETNTSYLSVIINHYKQMSFPNYLKDLRISSSIERLKKDPELLRYNYQGLADIFGFKTGETFSKAFYKKTGVYPSIFLNELKAKNNSGNL